MSGTVLPVALAAVAAACFAGAAVVQQGAVRTVVGAGEDRLSLARLLALVREPRWLAGSALAVAGVGLHAGALALAPLSTVQPVGVLAVPFTVALVFTSRRRRPPAGVLLGTALTVGGVTAFVTLAGSSGAGSPRVGAGLVVAALLVAVVVAVLAVLALRGRGRLRSVGCAAAAATSFGLVSLLLRTVLTGVGSGSLALVEPRTLALLAGMALAAGAGGWLAQQALASGAAAVSLAVLTLLDPVVAVTLGSALGDGAPATWLWPALAVVPAVTGVVVLSRFHPAATDARAGAGVRPSP